MQENHLPEKLEELDLMRLLAVSREIDLYDAQITILQMKLQEANRVNAALHSSLRDKYSLTERDQIDGRTGKIARSTAGQAESGLPDGQ
jgi:hypothetical protein